MSQHTTLKTLTMLAAALLFTVPGAMAEGSEESTSGDDYEGHGHGDKADCGLPTNWVTISDPFPTITIHWDCLPVS